MKKENHKDGENINDSLQEEIVCENMTDRKLISDSSLKSERNNSYQSLQPPPK